MIYTLETAARALGLGSREAVRVRMRSLAKRGTPLTVEAGELILIGEQHKLTELGLERLGTFVPIRAGRPHKKQATVASTEQE